jgi:ribosomal subunit interface protein
MTANMHITVAGKQVETGDALRTHVELGLSTIAEKYFDRAMEARVTFSKVRSFFACDINFHAGRNLIMRGEGMAPDAHRAFEQAAEHVGKRLRRYRRRVNEHARGLATERTPRETAQEYMLREEPEDHAEEIRTADHAAVVAEPATEIMHLTVGEAAMRLDLGNIPVMLFRNSASSALNVVYRRADGNVGWLDPGSN